MNIALKNLVNHQIRFSLLFFAAGLMVLGWAKTYPVLYSPEVLPVMTAVSPLFWIGLCLGFLSLMALSLSSRSVIVQWMCCVLVVVMLSAPHFLFIAWGSDAGGLANMSGYARQVGSFDFRRDLENISYFQWPASIFFNQFLADLLNINIYTAAALNFLLACIAVSSGLFLLWQPRLGDGQKIPGAVFWGVVVYFTGFYWVLSWQAAPYIFVLILLIPALALLERNSWQERLLLLVLVIPGFESHALFGVWLGMLVTAYLVISCLLRKRCHAVTVALVLFVIVAQVTIILYKNSLFLRYLSLQLKGYSESLLQAGGSNTAVAHQVALALSKPQGGDAFGAILKALSFVDLGFIGIAILTACLLAVVRKRLQVLEISLFLVGAAYCVNGMKYQAIGTRAIQLLALAPAYFVVEVIARGGRSGRFVLAMSAVGLLLFPAAIMRSHQNSANYIKPADLAFYIYTNRLQEDLRESYDLIFSEGIRPVDMRLNRLLLSPNTIGVSRECRGNLLLVDSPHLRAQMLSLFPGSDIQDVEAYLVENHPSIIYDNGSLSLRAGGDCTSLVEIFVPEPAVSK